MKSTHLKLLLVTGAFATTSNAAFIVVSPTDITYSGVQTTASAFNSVNRGNSDQFEVRSRVQNQINDAVPTDRDDRALDTFANFDISAIPANSIIIGATLSGTHDSRLNAVNPSGPASVGTVATAWDTSGSNNPLFSYGIDSVTGVTNAIDPQVLVADVENTVPTGATVTADLTTTVQDWYAGTLDNNGLVFFIDGFGSQGAGFNGVSLEVEYEAIPEPSALALLALGFLPLIRRRR